MDVPVTRRLILLGPQSKYASLKSAIDRIGCDGPVGLITAGWEDDEPINAQVRNALPSSSVNLRLFQRSEQLFNDDSELIQLLRSRQDELRVMRDGYLLRLDRILDAARKILIMNSQGIFDFSPECELTIDQLRQLDRQYFVRTSQVCDQYEQRLDMKNRRHVIKHREEIGDILDECGGIVISGGHAAIILNRLRIFGVLDMAAKQPIVAWSAGAMALADQIVLFHDSPPQGRGNPEVLRAGLGLFHEFLPLPDAHRRLKLRDKNRVSLFSRRFDRYKCVELNHRTILDRTDGNWSCTKCGQLNSDGMVEELEG